MTIRKMTLVMFLVMKGVVPGFEFEMRVVVQVMLRNGEGMVVLISLTFRW